MKLLRMFIPLMVVVIMAGCETVPVGPSVRVFPSPGKPYDLFLSEDSYCRQAAERQLGIPPQGIAERNTATGAIVGTAVGTGVGAALGAASGDMGAGVAIGAVSGLLIGSSVGSESGRVEEWEAQRRYDTVYMQCMYSHGNQVYSPDLRYYRRRAVIVNPPPSGDVYTPPDYVPLYPPPNTPPPNTPPPR